MEELEGSNSCGNNEEEEGEEEEEEEEEEDQGLTFSRTLGDGESSVNIKEDEEVPPPENKKERKKEAYRRSRSEVRKIQQKTEAMTTRAWSKSPVKSLYRKSRQYAMPKPIPDLSERLSKSSSFNLVSQTAAEKKRKNKFADVIRLPEPYNSITSDEVKRWCKDLKNVGTIGPESHNYNIYTELEFVNALIFKVSRLGKQGLIDKQSLLLLVCDIAGFQVEGAFLRKSTYSLFEFSRKLSLKRERCPAIEKIKLDLLACTWQPPVPIVRPEVEKRPPTAKPMEPQFYEFEDKKIEEDYKKLWNKCKDLENYQSILHDSQSKIEK